MNLRKIRKQRGLTQQQLGDMIGADHSTISYYESGRFHPSMTMLQKMRRALGVSYSELLLIVQEPAEKHE